MNSRRTSGSIRQLPSGRWRARVPRLPPAGERSPCRFQSLTPGPVTWRGSLLLSRTRRAHWPTGAPAGTACSRQGLAPSGSTIGRSDLRLHDLRHMV